MQMVKSSIVAALAAGIVAGCDMQMGGTAGASLESGLSYADFEAQFGTDRATTVAIDADNNGTITENEWQAAGY